MGFPAIAAQLGISIGLWAINRFLLDRGEKLRRPRREGFEFPLATVGTTLPYVAGTTRVTPVLAWYGNEGATLLSNDAYRYWTDLLYVIGTPLWDESTAPWSSWRATNEPALRALWYGDRKYQTDDLSNSTPYLLHNRKCRLFIYQVVAAGVYFYDGRADQVLANATPSLSTSIGNRMVISGIDAADIPGYRHRMLLGLIATPGAIDPLDPKGDIGTNPRVPAIAVEVSAVGPQPIGLDANPAWVLYDLLCRPVWGLGVDPDDVDLASFEAAANTLVAEGHGCSVAIEQAEDAARVFSAIQSQTDGVVYESPSTGKLRFRLIRNNYVVDDLPVMNADNVVGRPSVDDIHERDCPNEMRVNFTDRAREYKKDTLPWQKNASASTRGNQRRPTDFDAPGCTTAELAAKIAARELSVVGQPIRTIRIKVNREFHALELGDPVRVRLPQYQIDNEVYRVLEVDFGQLAAGTIECRLIRDIFDRTEGGSAGDPAPDNTPIVLRPLTKRYIDEAPWFLQYLAFNAGVISSLDPQRLLAAAADEGDLGNRFRGSSKSGGLTGVLNTGTVAEHGISFFPTTAVVATAYPRTAEPYDTTTGLVVSEVDGELASAFSTLAATATQIRIEGRNLALLGREVIAFEAVDDLGGGSFRLKRVWRGLLDTAPADHPIGTRLYLIGTDSVGRRAWPVGHRARVFSIPSYKLTIGSDGENASDDILIAGRAERELRAADLRVAGYDLEGTRGIPAVTEVYPRFGAFKAVSRLDGAVDVAARQNQLTAGQVVRGDDDAWTAAAGTTWDLYSQKVGEPEVAVVGKTGLAAPAAAGALVGGSGHGEIDLILHTMNGGKRSWQSPRVRISAARWRNLLANSSAEYGALSPGWQVVTGTAAVQSGTNSLSREPTGRWLTKTDGEATLRQIVDVSGYRPAGLTALAVFYIRNFQAEGSQSKLTVKALDSGAAVLASATSSTFVAPLALWRRAEVSLVLPAGTVSIEVSPSLFNALGSAAPDVGMTRIQLFVGQFSSELLANPSFDGDLTSWTAVSNSFVLNTTNPYSSRAGTLGSAQGGAFASSEIRQEATVPAGYEYGAAVLTFARSNSIADDTGQVVLEVLNSGDALIASSSTPLEAIPLNIWQRRRLAVQLPDGAATLRVRLIANRVAGSGNSGATFDDFSLRIHKDLDPATTIDFDFREPAWQPAPATWQRFHLDYPSLPIPSLVWGGAAPTPSIRTDEVLAGPAFTWSDAPAAHSPARFPGYWDVGPHPLFTDPSLAHVASIDAYRFVRAAAGSAIDLQATGADPLGREYGAIAPGESLTAALWYRVDEPGFAAACGLAGRRAASGIGWGLRITAGGALEAVLQGASGTATATRSGAVTDGAPRLAVLVYDALAQTLTVYDEAGSTTTSTSGVGSLAAAGAVLRIGRDSAASATLPGLIARALLWRHAALTSGQVAALRRYGADPSGKLTNWTSSAPVWVGGPADLDGTTLLRFAATHVPITFSAAHGGYALAVASANTNKVQSFDFTNASSWTAEAGVTLAQSVVDPTGLPRGVQVTNAGANQALRSAITMGASSPLRVVFWARTLDPVVSRPLALVLADSSGTTVDIDVVTLTSQWQRFDVTSTWTNPTPTGMLRFALGEVGSFELAHVLWAGFGDPPVAIQDAGVTLGNTYGARVAALPAQLNREDELYAEVAASVATPASGAVIVSVDNGTTDGKNRRALTLGSSGAPSFALANDSASVTTQSGTAIAWTQPATLRGRWNRLALPESSSNQIGLVVGGSVASTDYDPLAFTVGTTGLAAIRIGGGDPSGSASPHAAVRRVIVSSREPKLG